MVQGYPQPLGGYLQNRLTILDDSNQKHIIEVFLNSLGPETSMNL